MALINSSSAASSLATRRDNSRFHIGIDDHAVVIRLPGIHSGPQTLSHNHLRARCRSINPADDHADVSLHSDSSGISNEAVESSRRPGGQSLRPSPAHRKKPYPTSLGDSKPKAAATTPCKKVRTTMEPRLDIMTNGVAAVVIPCRGEQGRRRLFPTCGNPGADEDPGQPDQRLRLLPGHAHRGRREGRRDPGAAQPCRRVAGSGGVFTEAERAALELTEQGTRIADGGGVTDEAWANAAKHYDDDEPTAIVSQIAIINAFNRLNVIMQRPAGDYQAGQFG